MLRIICFMPPRKPCVEGRRHALCNGGAIYGLKIGTEMADTSGDAGPRDGDHEDDDTFSMPSHLSINTEEIIVPDDRASWSMTRWVSKKACSIKLYLQRTHAAQQFVNAVKTGDTATALLCLANNSFLLAYHTFAKDGDTVRTIV